MCKWFICIDLRLIQNNGLGTRYETVFRWMPQNIADNKLTSFQIMAWCHRATRHYLSQCWPRSLSTYRVTGPAMGWRLPDRCWILFYLRVVMRNACYVLCSCHYGRSQVSMVVADGLVPPFWRLGISNYRDDVGRSVYIRSNALMLCTIRKDHCCFLQQMQCEKCRRYICIPDS